MEAVVGWYSEDIGYTCPFTSLLFLLPPLKIISATVVSLWLWVRCGSDGETAGWPQTDGESLKFHVGQCCCLVTQSCPTLGNPVDCSFPCPSLFSRAYSNSCPSSWWCHPAISSSVVPFSSCLQSFPASGLFQWVSSSHQVAKVLEFLLQHQSFQSIFRVDFL